MSDLQKLMTEVDEWQIKTFGHDKFSYNRTIVAMMNHLEEEVGELKELVDMFWVNPNKHEPKNYKELGSEEIREEFADCFMLLIGAAAKYGLTAEELLSDTYKKLAKNKKRKWGKPQVNGVVNHVE